MRASAALAFKNILDVAMLIRSSDVQALEKLLKDRTLGREREIALAALVNLSNSAKLKTVMAHVGACCTKVDVPIWYGD